MIPKEFSKYFWSYDFRKLDVKKHQARIFVNLLNYGDLESWKWLVNTYGKPGCREMLSEIQPSEFRPQARTLAELMF